MPQIERIIVEIPDYLHNVTSSENTPFYDFFFNFISVVAINSPVPVIFRKSNAELYEAPRLPNQGELVFAYHSYYDEQNVWHIKESPIVPLFSIDKSGYSGAASIAINPDLYKDQIEDITVAEANDIIDTLRHNFYSRKVSKYAQSFSSTDDLPQRFVFFPLQTFDDSVTKFYNFDVIESLKKAARLAEENEIYLLVKTHPRCKYKDKDFANYIKTIFCENPFVKVVDYNIYDLIQKCRSVITFNSGVGIEALIGGAIVYSLGSSEWQDASIKIKNLDELKFAFEQKQPSLDTYQKKLLAFLLTKYWLSAKDPNAIEAKFLQCIKEYQLKDTSENSSKLNQLFNRLTKYELLLKKTNKNLQQVINFLEIENETLRNSLNLKIFPRKFTFKRIFQLGKYSLVKKTRSKK